MRSNKKLKGERREDTLQNNRKMIVRGRSIFTLVRVKANKGRKKK